MTSQPLETSLTAQSTSHSRWGASSSKHPAEIIHKISNELPQACTAEHMPETTTTKQSCCLRKSFFQSCADTAAFWLGLGKSLNKAVHLDLKVFVQNFPDFKWHCWVAFFFFIQQLLATTLALNTLHCSGQQSWMTGFYSRINIAYRSGSGSAPSCRGELLSGGKKWVKCEWRKLYQCSAMLHQVCVSLCSYNITSRFQSHQERTIVLLELSSLIFSSIFRNVLWPILEFQLGNVYWIIK